MRTVLSFLKSLWFAVVALLVVVVIWVLLLKLARFLWFFGIFIFVGTSDMSR